MAPFWGLFEHRTPISSPGRAAFQGCAPNVPVFPITFHPSPQLQVLLSVAECTSRGNSSALYSRFPAEPSSRSWPDPVNDLGMIFQGTGPWPLGASSSSSSCQGALGELSRAHPWAVPSSSWKCGSGDPSWL